jgi:transketolase
MNRMGDVCGRLLAERAEQDSNLWVLDGDLADSNGAIHFAERHPNRFIMAGIAEQCMTTVAAGMATCGLRPWVFSFAAFLCYRAYDQIRVGLSQMALPVTLVGSHAGGLAGRNGKTHQALNDITLMSTLPGIEIWAPGGPDELSYIMDTIIAGTNPVYLRLPREPLEPLGGSPAPCRWLTPETQIAFISSGLATQLALSARARLAQSGIEIGVFHCARLAPLNSDRLHASLAHVESLFVVEDHYSFGGLASLLAQTQLCTKMHAFGWPQNWCGGSGSTEELLDSQGLSPARIADAVEQFLNGSPSHHV